LFSSWVEGQKHGMPQKTVDVRSDYQNWRCPKRPGGVEEVLGDGGKRGKDAKYWKILGGAKSRGSGGGRPSKMIAKGGKGIALRKKRDFKKGRSIPGGGGEGKDFEIGPK